MPPPSAEADSPLSEWVNHVCDMMALMPLTTTVHSTHTSGTSAMRTDRVTSTVAVRSVERRRNPTPWKAGALIGLSRTLVIGQSRFPAIAARAAALTTKVSTNRTRPAAM